MKLAYNITYVVDPRFVDHWRQWMTSEYVPAIMQTGCFLSYRLHKLIGLTHTDEPTYSLQFLANDKSGLQKFQKEYEAEHQKLLYSKFRDKVVEFQTTMVVVEEG